MGGGIGLSLYGNYRIVTDTTKFAMPETAIGFFPDVGGSYFLPRIKNNVGIFLALTGHIIDSSEILNLGLGTHYCPNSEIENFIDQYIMEGKLFDFGLGKLYVLIWLLVSQDKTIKAKKTSKLLLEAMKLQDKSPYNEYSASQDLTLS